MLFRSVKVRAEGLRGPGEQPQDAALEESLPAFAQGTQGVGTELRVPPRAGVQIKQGGFLGG